MRQKIVLGTEYLHCPVVHFELIGRHEPNNLYMNNSLILLMVSNMLCDLLWTKHWQNDANVSKTMINRPS